jgi:hypothetical protein
MLRRILNSISLALVAAAPFSVQAASVGGVAGVVAVQPTRVADLILLDHGFNAGLRQGMVCRVTRGTTEIAEILLADLRPSCSSALILNVAAKQSIRAGDTVSVKILKT